MTKLNALFDKFLQNIEPDEKMVRYAHSAHDPIRTFLEEDGDFGQYVEDTFLYGSYKRHTAVGDIKDVDIVVLTNFDTESEDYAPQKVLRKLKSALARHYGDPKNQEYQRRSIRVNDPLPDNKDVEMTLDVIPAVATDGNDNPLLVPDRDVKKWILSHPKGHLEHTTELNKDQNSKGRFVPLVKIMKWWWKYQCEIRQPDVERPKPKGFWVEVLTGENFDASKHDWIDHFIATLESISEKYSDVEDVPELPDPGLSEETVRTSMTLDEFQVFMEAVNESLEQAKEARSENNDLRSSEIYKDIFGDEFPLFDKEENEQKRAEAKVIPLGAWSHIKPPHWPENLRRGFKVRIDAYLYDSTGTVQFGGINSDSRVIQSGLQVKYVAQTNTHNPYQVYWQVVNTGKHAESNNGLRGGFFEAKLLSGSKSTNQHVNWEHTEYTGKHWIECFIVQNGELVARSGKFYLNIKNPNY
jgi:hypothetical protein